jgi:hypothetical protein
MLYCVTCGYILPYALETESESTVTLPLPDAQGIDVEWGTSFFHQRARLFLEIPDKGLAIPVPLDADVVVVGRTSVTGSVNVDLAPYGAAAMGVSRRHIRIDRVHDDSGY